VLNIACISQTFEVDDATSLDEFTRILVFRM
jgi:hypothetical protein